MIKKGGTDSQAKDFVARLFRNVPVLDAGGRGATTTFVQRGIGDALLTFENEVFLIRKELGRRRLRRGLPVDQHPGREPGERMVDKVVDKRGTRKVAQAYLEYLYSEQGQETGRARTISVRAIRRFWRATKRTFAELRPVHRRRGFRRLEEAQAAHFSDGGLVRPDLPGQIGHERN